MSTTQQPAPFDHEAVLVVEVSENYTADNGDRLIDVSGAHTITLPPKPEYGQTHRILAASGNVTVAGNGHTIAGSHVTVPAFKSADYTFSHNDTWIGSLCPIDR